ncbi:cell adhesion molecule CEACAM5-like [Hemitrygon akajei]|uniref:cell adhesion molecule CEACAM5-like n=1 Tax=Hemitrygon akajei TaxID=2704970 RepID=UPI003BFA1862
MVPISGSQTSATISLRVTEPVSNVTVTSNANMLIEYSDTVRLTCSARGTDVSYLWLEENSVIIPGGRFELSADHSTLTVSGVLRTDGSFTCRASNLINEITSDPLYLDVNYGPDRPHIITEPDSPFHVAGSTIRLTCFTESRPGAELNWQLNGAHLHSGQEVILDNITVSHTGKYTCEAYNSVTKRNNASTTEIIVFGPVTGVAVVTNDSTPLENLDTIALSCDASGTVETRTWFKDDQPIQENGRIFTSPDKAKLTIISVNRNDAGTYKCIASNSFSNGAGETYVQVYYGPEKVRIVPKRPVVSNIASNLTLACFALSVPWGEYTWYNGNNLLQTGQELTLVSVSSVDVGSYTCRVTNGVTNRNSYLTVHVTAQATKTDDNITLTTGAIVGIALGLLGMGLIGGVSGWLIARKTGRVKKSPPPQYETSSNFGRNGTLDTNTVNVSPSYVNFPRNEQGANNNVQGERHTYMTLNLGDRSAYSDLKR